MMERVGMGALILVAAIEVTFQGLYIFQGLRSLAAAAFAAF